MIKEGSKAPEFSLPSSEGKNIGLGDLKGKWVVLYFYPKDDTPGCTKEACDFRDGYGEYKKMGVEVLGVSTDALDSHEKFKNKYSLPFPLLADTEKKMVKDYGVWKEKSMFGKKYMGTERMTFIIDPEGVVRKIYSKVKVLGHNKKVLEFLQANK